MIIRPQSKGFICLTAHPDGCAKNVADQIALARSTGKKQGPRNVLIIGASAGYGLSSRVMAAFGYGAKTLGVFYEKPADEKRTASPGWYHTAAFEREAHAAGLQAASVNGDAFSNDIKKKTLSLLKQSFGPVDLVVYSLASPRRVHPETGEIFSSVLKPILRPYSSKTIHFQTGVISDVAIAPATQAEISQTVAVMGGEDWNLWMEALEGEGLLAPNATTVAYSYAGPELTEPIYRRGTIGRAKDHLETMALHLNQRLGRTGGRAVVSVNKALVTQASSAIPVMPLYISILYKTMKSRGLHEGCMEQMARLFNDHLYADTPPPRDEANRIRIDDWEMRADVQNSVARAWDLVNARNVERWTDLAGYKEDFFKLFGFGREGIDELIDVNPIVPIPSLEP
ncbi:MAG: trans-2-enoyl-CoA reductase family protein [Elusimicrobia bacterium]|jgi:enoyl-[acyl-carrier protein] reductase/trans-2-enoyl-CoA reductase (NAD+)|nr:trans-2-enoyl-CoA reductase family protein [Elusimicrobiota bacterium]